MFKIKETGERISQESDYNSYIEQFNIYFFFADFINNLSGENLISLVDCACGTGYGLDHYNRHILKKKILLGVDIDKGAVDFCTKKYTNILFQQGSILDSELIKDNSLDIYSCNQTLEHFYRKDQDIILERQYKALKKGGYLLLCVPNKPVYQKFDPNNKWHLNELSHEEFSEIIETQPWDSIEYHGQKIPTYQQNSGLRSNKYIKRILGILPVNFIYWLANLINPKITSSDILIERYTSENELQYKLQIAICKK